MSNTNLAGTISPTGTTAQKPHQTNSRGHAKPEVQFGALPKTMEKKGKSMMKKKKNLRPGIFPDALKRFVEVMPIEQEKILLNAVRELMEPTKGILAVDDSARMLDLKLSNISLSPTEDNRRKYLELLLTASYSMSNFLSAVIFRENIIEQKAYVGKRLTTMVKEAGLSLGIRVDQGYVRTPGTRGEWSTEGLDDFEEVCRRLKTLGACCAMWRCVYTTAEVDTPSNLVMQINSNTLATFASNCQKMALVPILSPDVLWTGGRSVDECQAILRQVLSSMFKSLHDYHVFIEGIILRVPPVYSPTDTPETVGKLTLTTVNEVIPAAVGGVVLSSQQDFNWSMNVLDAINKCHVKKPTIFSFCFSNVIQDGVAESWGGLEKNVKKAQEEFLKKLKLCSVASMGQLPERNQSVFVTNITVL